MTRADDPAVYSSVKQLAAGLQAGGSTAIFAAREAALDEAVRDRTTDARYDTIVLMTDGENNHGDDFNAFAAKWYALPPFAQHIRIFPIFIGKRVRALVARDSTAARDPLERGDERAGRGRRRPASRRGGAAQAPARHRARAGQIATDVVEILPRLPAHGVVAATFADVRSTATSYLPDTLNAS
ncbi:hypothetical protein WPS_31910 [Vulcanimicrobium alpinum]|uniref:VWFA domain-containing protein n=2 Tax=Vulcanimicrobium alpinum TaxID=3016050 RepID=A0AAN1XZR6_UNVUL|nr:hypothetical protein WPS_31910 [Vulcanimicrobium alpinum]